MTTRSKLESFLWIWVILIVVFSAILVSVSLAAFIGFFPGDAKFTMRGTQSFVVVAIIGILIFSLWGVLAWKMRNPTVGVLYFGLILFSFSIVSIIWENGGVSLIPVKVFSYALTFPSGLKFEIDIASIIISMLFFKALSERKRMHNKERNGLDGTDVPPIR